MLLPKLGVQMANDPWIRGSPVTLHKCTHITVRFSHHPPTVQLQRNTYCVTILCTVTIRLVRQNAPGTYECHATCTKLGLNR